MVDYKLRFFLSLELSEGTYNEKEDDIDTDKLHEDVCNALNVKDSEYELDCMWQDSYLYWIAEGYVEVPFRSSKDIKKLVEDVDKLLDGFQQDIQVFSVVDKGGNEVFNEESEVWG